MRTRIPPVASLRSGKSVYHMAETITSDVLDVIRLLHLTWIAVSLNESLTLLQPQKLEPEGQRSSTLDNPTSRKYVQLATLALPTIQSKAENKLIGSTATKPNTPPKASRMSSRQLRQRRRAAQEVTTNPLSCYRNHSNFQWSQPIFRSHPSRRTNLVSLTELPSAPNKPLAVFLTLELK